MVAAVLLVLSYLLGTFPTARLVAGRAIEGGSGNPGASNAFRVAGARAGIAVFAGDLAKGVLATAIGHAAQGRPLAFACGAAAVVGHCFPVTRRFKGGKGVATAAGTALVLFPVPALVAAAAWGAIAKATHKASVASVIAILVIPAGAAIERRPAWELAALAAVALLVVARHAPNLKRLARGEEQSLMTRRPG
ncbi:MAG: glycerol-3-phosphate acyltransferase [Actinobacteria bacterium]|nr:glycerol-3-phosphate acyltransferase [Actinomycetota bacterium]MBV9935925.1 glycerol-3-phosphate acyltransferase [Actinomycetota bacterium]